MTDTAVRVEQEVADEIKQIASDNAHGVKMSYAEGIRWLLGEYKRLKRELAKAERRAEATA